MDGGSDVRPDKGRGHRCKKTGAWGRGVTKGVGTVAWKGVCSGKNLESLSVDYEELNKHCYGHCDPPFSSTYTEPPTPLWRSQNSPQTRRVFIDY
jgi:hypothetical protein